MKGTLNLGALGARAQASLDIKIIVRKGEHYGDWATNLLQGAGAHTRAYEYAMRYATEVMADKIKYTEQKQITFTGHSLGGGLATTANYAAHYAAMKIKKKIKKEIKIYKYMALFSTLLEFMNILIKQRLKQEQRVMSHNGIKIGV